MRGVRAALLSILAVLALPATLRAEGRAGLFDFYVLALSWSPTFCLSGAGRKERLQCQTERRGFIVHGLWPQHERGWPQYCPSNEPAEVPRSLVTTMLDLMPSPDLVQHQWRKHGACAGLDQASYFTKVREAGARIAIPEALRTPARPGFSWNWSRPLSQPIRACRPVALRWPARTAGWRRSVSA